MQSRLELHAQRRCQRMTSLGPMRRLPFCPRGCQTWQGQRTYLEGVDGHLALPGRLHGAFLAGGPPHHQTCASHRSCRPQWPSLQTPAAKGCSVPEGRSPPSKAQFHGSPCTSDLKGVVCEAPVLLSPMVRLFPGVERALEVHRPDLQSEWPAWQCVARAPWWREPLRPGPGRASAQTL